MKIHTDYYGEIEYSKEDLVTFPEGLFGFPDLKYYLPLCLSDDDDSMLILQSTEKPEVVFLFINPAFLYPDYLPKLTSEELYYLKVSDSGELSYYVICVIKDNYMDNTVNLKCPLAINPLTRVGMQIILENSPYGFHHKLDSFPHVAVQKQPDNRSDCHVDSQAQEE